MQARLRNLYTRKPGDRKAFRFERDFSIADKFPEKEKVSSNEIENRSNILPRIQREQRILERTGFVRRTFIGSKSSLLERDVALKEGGLPQVRKEKPSVESSVISGKFFKPPLDKYIAFDNSIYRGSGLIPNSKIPGIGVGIPIKTIDSRGVIPGGWLNRFFAWINRAIGRV